MKLQEPSRDEVAEVIRRLLDGKVKREDVARWASRWLLSDDNIEDEITWNTLVLLGAADLPCNDREFLYEDVDFRMALQKLRN